VKLHHLRDVLAVAERGSLRAAARDLGVAQSALSRSIREIEKDLGVALFERRARGVVPTQSGELFLRRAHAVKSELQRARDEIDQSKGLAHGKLTVCLSAVAHMALLPHALRPFRRRYPSVHLEIHDAVYPTIEGLLADGTLDFYVGPPPEHLPSQFAAEKLFDNTRVILGRKGHPLAGAKSLRDLVDAEWLTTSVTYKAEQEIAPMFAKHGLPAPKLVLQARSFLSLLVTAAYSDLIAMLPVQFTEFPLTRDALQRISVKEPLPAPSVYIIRRAGLPLTPAAEHFCDLIRRASGHLGKKK
jgi:LysR family transcriptional regulator of abg operon